MIMRVNQNGSKICTPYLSNPIILYFVHTREQTALESFQRSHSSFPPSQHTKNETFIFSLTSPSPIPLILSNYSPPHSKQIIKMFAKSKDTKAETKPIRLKKPPVNKPSLLPPSTTTSVSGPQHPPKEKPYTIIDKILANLSTRGVHGTDTSIIQRHITALLASGIEIIDEQTIVELENNIEDAVIRGVGGDQSSFLENSNNNCTKDGSSSITADNNSKSEDSDGWSIISAYHADQFRQEEAERGEQQRRQQQAVRNALDQQVLEAKKVAKQAKRAVLNERLQVEREMQEWMEQQRLSKSKKMMAVKTIKEEREQQVKEQGRRREVAADLQLVVDRELINQVRVQADQFIKEREQYKTRAKQGLEALFSSNEESKCARQAAAQREAEQDVLYARQYEQLQDRLEEQRKKQVENIKRIQEASSSINANLGPFLPQRFIEPSVIEKQQEAMEAAQALKDKQAQEKHAVEINALKVALMDQIKAKQAEIDKARQEKAADKLVVEQAAKQAEKEAVQRSISEALAALALRKQLNEQVYKKNTCKNASYNKSGVRYHPRVSATMTQTERQMNAALLRQAAQSKQ
jgi:hypothetical protein